MKFDTWWLGDGVGEPETASVLPLASDGRHSGEITKVVVKDLAFKQSQTNATGKSLIVTVSVPQAQPIEAIIPVQMRGLIEAVCRSAGVEPPDPASEWEETTLVGRSVVIDTVQGIGKTGREYVRIEKWHAGPAPLPAAIKKAAARTQAAKAHKAFTEIAGADDIPF